MYQQMCANNQETTNALLQRVSSSNNANIKQRFVRLKCSPQLMQKIKSESTTGRPMSLSSLQLQTTFVSKQKVLKKNDLKGARHRKYLKHHGARNGSDEDSNAVSDFESEAASTVPDDKTEELYEEMSIAGEQMKYSPANSRKRDNGILNEEKNVHEHDKCCSACRMERRLILQKLNQILALLNPTESKHKVMPIMKENYNLLPPLPFETEEDLLLFDERLKVDSEMQSQFESKMASLGGSSMPKFVYNIMSKMITDELAVNLTWVASNGKTKVINLHFPNVIFDAVRTKFTDVTEVEVKKKIQVWLQKPSDRISNRNRKIEREQFQETQWMQ